MLVIGIAGGVGSGKSSVAKELALCGATVLDADQIGHELLDEIDVQERLVERWGSEVKGPTGAIDRAAVAEVVFSGTAAALSELSFLEELIHPRIAGQVETHLAELKEAASVEVVVLDAAVMFKTGWDRFCDKFLFVEVAESERIARCQQRGWTVEEFRRREASQESLEWKRQRADWMVDNSGTLLQMTEQVKRIWDQLITT